MEFNYSKNSFGNIHLNSRKLHANIFPRKEYSDLLKIFLLKMVPTIRKKPIEKAFQTLISAQLIISNFMNSKLVQYKLKSKNLNPNGFDEIIVMEIFTQLLRNIKFNGHETKKDWFFKKRLFFNFLFINRYFLLTIKIFKYCVKKNIFFRVNHFKKTQQIELCRIFFERKIIFDINNINKIISSNAIGIQKMLKISSKNKKFKGKLLLINSEGIDFFGYNTILYILVLNLVLITNFQKKNLNLIFYTKKKMLTWTTDCKLKNFFKFLKNETFFFLVEIIKEGSNDKKRLKFLRNFKILILEICYKSWYPMYNIVYLKKFLSLFTNSKKIVELFIPIFIIHFFLM